MSERVGTSGSRSIRHLTTRRGFLGGTGVALAAGLTACAGSTTAKSGSAGSTSSSKTVDVVVVGAGLAGLKAATDLVAAGKTVAVLEANDRVGGRAWTKTSGEKFWIDMGAQWVGPTQDHILDLIADVGLSTFPFYKQGKATLIFDGDEARFDPTIEQLPIPDVQVDQIRSASTQLDELASTVPTDAPWTAPNAAELDSTTVEAWMAENVPSRETNYLMRELVWGWMATDAKDVSLLHLLFYINAGGGMDSLETDGIAFRVDGGTQQIAQILADRIGKDSVLLEHPITRIEQRDGRVIVSGPNGTFEADRVIVAIPPTLAGAINFDPVMPANRAQLTQRAPMGSTIKCHAVYETSFWREQGLSGFTFSDSTPLVVTADVSPPSGTPGILTAFFEGQGARDWTERPVAEIKQQVIDALSSYFGSQAQNPSQVFVANWPSEPWARGCFAAFMPPGVWTGYQDAIRRPVGRIHWAGTETATRWYAYMDGAVSSGERAAAEVLAQT